MVVRFFKDNLLHRSLSILMCSVGLPDDDGGDGDERITYSKQLTTATLASFF